MRLFFLVIIALNFAMLSAQDEVIYYSGKIPGNDTVWVFKPSDYNVSQKYPAIYLLHGISGKYSSWSRLVNLQEYADYYQFIIICPDGFFDSYYLNSPLIENSQFESFFTDELYPQILGKYMIDSSKIFITGLSMGGAGAMYLFLRNHKLFLSAGSTSGVLDLNYSKSKRKLLGLLGNYTNHKQVFNDYSAIAFLENIQETDKQIIFDCGTEDHLYECNNMFRKKCDELKIQNS